MTGQMNAVPQVNDVPYDVVINLSGGTLAASFIANVDNLTAVTDGGSGSGSVIGYTGTVTSGHEFSIITPTRTLSVARMASITWMVPMTFVS